MLLQPRLLEALRQRLIGGVGRNGCAGNRVDAVLLHDLAGKLLAQLAADALCLVRGIHQRLGDLAALHADGNGHVADARRRGGVDLIAGERRGGLLLLLDVAGDDVGAGDGVGNRARAVAVAHGEHVHARSGQLIKQRAVGRLRQRVDDVVGGDVHLDAALALDVHAPRR